MKQLLVRAKATRGWKAWKRYSDVRGNILAGGVGYFAFLSVFPAVALAFTVFGLVLRGRPDLLGHVTSTLGTMLPGFIQDAQHPDAPIPVKAPAAGALTITGVVAFVSLVLAGLGWLGGLREGIRAVFGVTGSVGNAVTSKLRDLGVLATLGLGVFLSAVLTAVVGAAAGWAAERLGLGNAGWLVTSAGLVVSAAIDATLMLLLFRVLADIDVDWRRLRDGAVVGGIAFTVMKYFGAFLIARATRNPLYGSIAIVVGLLFWLNLIARVILIAAAWAANDVGPLKPAAEPVGPQSGPPPRDPALPSFGTRAADRTTLAAGAVLGLTGAIAVRAVGRSLRGVRDLVRS
ncbi:YihY/virulence factor BrkB family protein [Oryzihumus leptocrescens]|uniref:Membrane protein n=1 Tax=Oryzihumus leptocrescens TaxID=297536 RepID=A0A542ZFY1_9MICO|nr:YihY/virulence factor BrkB family protein [Oryzihumus leptocrescens]TQL59231.1 membrane protein [Oryzihumus leptocrescens]